MTVGSTPITRSMITANTSTTDIKTSPLPCNPTITSYHADLSPIAEHIIHDLMGTGGLNLHGLTFTPLMIAALLGNWTVESHLNPHATNMTHYGIAQWGGSRWTRLTRLATQRGTSPYNLQTQVQYAIIELAGPYHTAYQHLQQATTLQTAALTVAADYEECPQVPSPRVTVVNDWQAGQQRIRETQWYAHDLGLLTTLCNTLTTRTAPSTTAAHRTYQWMDNQPQGWEGFIDQSDERAYGYQCVWYLWNRLYMLHTASYQKHEWTVIQGNGGQLQTLLIHQPGWILSTTPRAGDGLSLYWSGQHGKTDPAGHAAVIEAVSTSNNGQWKILISQGNWDLSGDGPWNGYNEQWVTEHTMTHDTSSYHFFCNTAWNTPPKNH